MRKVLCICALLALQAGVATATLEYDPAGLIRVETRVVADSVTVGERFAVVHAISFPDSLVMIPPEALDPGNCRVLSQRWREGRSGVDVTRTASISLITLDLEAARVPETHFDFRTPSGDTLRVFTRDVEVPVRHVAEQSRELAPLKQQWEAPPGVWVWVATVGSALALAALAWYLLRRRRRQAAGYVPPPLPADHVALRELARIEKLGLVDQGELKQHYTLVVDVLRHYLERRYRVDAMDRTSDELLEALSRRKVIVPALDGLLGEADLVKFAKFVPDTTTASGSVDRARDIVVSTRPRPVAAPSPAQAGEEREH